MYDSGLLGEEIQKECRGDDGKVKRDDKWKHVYMMCLWEGDATQV